MQLTKESQVESKLGCGKKRRILVGSFRIFFYFERLSLECSFYAIAV